MPPLELPPVFEVKLMAAHANPAMMASLNPLLKNHFMMSSGAISVECPTVFCAVAIFIADFADAANCANIPTDRRYTTATRVV